MTLLSTQILTAPAIWDEVQNLETPLQILSTLAYATIHHNSRRLNGLLPINSIPLERWIVAVTDGANDLSAKWKHLLVFCGLLLGLQKAANSVSLACAESVEMDIVRVTNGIMCSREGPSWWTVHVLPLAIGSVFGSLSAKAKTRLHYETLVPLVLQSTFRSDIALNSGYFLSSIDIDVLQTEGNRFHWSFASTTYEQIRRLIKSPLVGTLGSLSQIVAFGIRSTEQSSLLTALVDDLLAFCRSLDVQWRQNKLSEIDSQEENHFLTEETRNSTLPDLWRLLQSVSFAVVTMLSSLLETVLRTAVVPRQSGLQLYFSSKTISLIGISCEHRCKRPPYASIPPLCHIEDGSYLIFRVQSCLPVLH